jgi:RHS repeat-associated protein
VTPNSEFLVPARSYKLRVDYSGKQYWSDVFNVIAGEESTLAMSLDQLALNTTNDPKPVRFDGISPVFQHEPIQVASLGSLIGILSQAAVANPGSVKVYYYLNDHLGTPQLLMDLNAVVTWKANYEPFGEVTVEPTSVSEEDLRFPGQYFDRETRLHYNYYRYYEPRTGRYLMPDPIGQIGGINLYIYVGGNAINAFDSFGLYDIWDFGEDTLSFAAGLGNAVTFGGTTWIVERFMSGEDAAILRKTKRCAGAFKAGEWASLGLGAGRLAYAGLAKGSSMFLAARGMTMQNAAAASAFRNSLKKWFSINPWRNFRIYPFEKMIEKYPNAEEIIRAAGRTSAYYNLIGAYITLSSATALETTDDCECD